MRPLSTHAALVFGLGVYVAAQVPADASLKQLYDTHSWFELRNAVKGESAPALYLGAIASAFGRIDEAETYLARAVREASSGEAANEAREGLINLYLRVARSSDAVRLLDQALAVAPSRSDFQNVRGLLGSFSRYPNQTVRTGRGQTFPCTVNASGLFMPVSINGRPVEWLVDTAFSMSALSESEARMLGVSMQSATAQAGDFAGGTTTTRGAVAERVAIGDACR